MSVQERLASVRAELREVEEALDDLDALQRSERGDYHAAREHVAEEVFDVIWNLCDLTELLAVDLEAAARVKMAHNFNRTWQVSGEV